MLQSRIIQIRDLLKRYRDIAHWHLWGHELKLLFYSSSLSFILQNRLLCDTEEIRSNLSPAYRYKEKLWSKKTTFIIEPHPFEFFWLSTSRSPGGSLSQLSQIENVMSSAILTKDKDPCVQTYVQEPLAQKTHNIRGGEAFFICCVY